MILGIVAITIWILMDWCYRNEGEVVLSPIKGFMIGALYNGQEIDKNETEHIVQLLFFVFSVNFIWVVKK